MSSSGRPTPPPAFSDERQRTFSAERLQRNRSALAPCAERAEGRIAAERERRLQSAVPRRRGSWDMSATCSRPPRLRRSLRSRACASLRRGSVVHTAQRKRSRADVWRAASRLRPAARVPHEQPAAALFTQEKGERRSAPAKVPRLRRRRGSQIVSIRRGEPAEPRSSRNAGAKSRVPEQSRSMSSVPDGRRQSSTSHFC